MVRIDSVNCGYTAQGNPYKKSSVGKNVGTAAGFATVAALGTVPYSAYAKLYKKVGVSDAILESFSKIAKKYKNPVGVAKEFIKGDLTKNVPTNTGIKFLNKINSLFKNNKSARIAYVAAGIGFAAFVCGSVGRLIGSIVDKYIDKGAMAEADKNAAIDKAV